MNWLLLFGLARVSIFMFGAWYGWRTRHWLMVSACAAVSTSAFVFALHNADVIGNSWLVTLAAYWSTPMAVGVVAAMVFNHIEPADNDGWRP